MVTDTLRRRKNSARAVFAGAYGGIGGTGPLKHPTAWDNNQMLAATAVILVNLLVIIIGAKFSWGIAADIVRDAATNLYIFRALQVIVTISLTSFAIRLLHVVFLIIRRQG